MTKVNRFLVIDDEAGIREFLCDAADDLGYSAVGVATPEEFFATHRAFSPTVIAIDMKMPNADGVEILRQLAERSSKAKMLLISGMDSKVLMAAQRLGAQYGLSMLGVLQKPINIEDLDAILEAARRPEEVSEIDIESGIERAEFVLYYQPKVALRGDGSMDIIGAEALVRWEHPKHGLIGADKIIPLAEQTGWIAALTDYIVGEAITELAKWQTLGLDLTVAVNLPPQLLNDLDLPDQFSRRLRDEGVSPEMLTLEITESAAMADGPTTADILTRIRLKNIALSLDDFGVGFSSLVELYRMPFTELKIDRSFVGDVDKSEEARIIVRTLVGLAQSLNLSACAEGVETEATLEYLKSIGCDKLQGYLISRPLPADLFVDFVRKWRIGNLRNVAALG